MKIYNGDERINFLSFRSAKLGLIYRKFGKLLLKERTIVTCSCNSLPYDCVISFIYEMVIENPRHVPALAVCMNLTSFPVCSSFHSTVTTGTSPKTLLSQSADVYPCNIYFKLSSLIIKDLFIRFISLWFRSFTKINRCFHHVDYSLSFWQINSRDLIW